jgi:hypothetical protein
MPRNLKRGSAGGLRLDLGLRQTLRQRCSLDAAKRNPGHEAAYQRRFPGFAIAPPRLRFYASLGLRRGPRAKTVGLVALDPPVPHP